VTWYPLLKILPSYIIDGGNGIRNKTGLTSNPGIEIEANDHSVQNLAPPNNLQRFEGIAFSSLGNIIGVATFRYSYCSSLSEKTKRTIRRYTVSDGRALTIHTIFHCQCQATPNCSLLLNVRDQSFVFLDVLPLTPNGKVDGATSRLLIRQTGRQFFRTRRAFAADHSGCLSNPASLSDSTAVTNAFRCADDR
jgi:hypothetical protein